MKSAPQQQKEFDIDFDAELPNFQFFPVWLLAKTWHCHRTHVVNLIEAGELKVPVDLRGANSSKSMWRVPRASIIEFLNKRKARP